MEIRSVTFQSASCNFRKTRLVAEICSIADTWR
ncbi:hypothetical protein F383_08992 [Gossypium arboreum]|uniref:Uncharacterized protein n=1 Tax=Gossypium arboreum TaxID=29729 RepID=A0A0B0P0C6_GOSAR|nr:hypothetical protein F383_08992 [Gossypium arboreum]